MWKCRHKIHTNTLMVSSICLHINMHRILSELSSAVKLRFYERIKHCILTVKFLRLTNSGDNHVFVSIQLCTHSTHTTTQHTKHKTQFSLNRATTLHHPTDWIVYLLYDFRVFDLSESVGCNFCFLVFQIHCL